MKSIRALVAIPILATSVLLLAGVAAAQDANSSPDLQAIITRLEQAQIANRATLQSYEVVRQYDFYAQDEKSPSSKVVAEVQFAPPAEKSYSITQTVGSGRTESIVKKILDGEVAAAHEHRDHDLSRSNYDFKYLGEQVKDGVRCYALQLIPKREDKSLLKGTAWIDAANYLPWRVEGEPARNPSWWVKELHIKMEFAPVDGMWLQSGGVGQADIRIFGRHTVVSRVLDWRTSEQMASRRGPRRVRRPEAIIGAGFPRE